MPASALAAFPSDTPAHAHEARPSAQTSDPRITLTAKRDTIIAGLEDLVLTLTREGAAEDSLTVALSLAQDHEWITRGEVDCGTKPAPVPAPLYGMGALLSGSALARRRVRWIQALSGSTQSAAPSPTQRQVIVRGELSSGPVLRFHVPDRRGQAKYRVKLLQVSAEDYLLCDLTDYRAVIRRQAP